MSAKKSWSLQNDKRTEAERNIFKPTGKSPKNKFKWYLLALSGAFFAVSFFMTYFSETILKACVGNFCFNSKDDILIYSAYVFSTIVFVVLAIFGAYLLGRKIGNTIKA